jgi:hypothetical protein
MRRRRRLSCGRFRIERRRSLKSPEELMVELEAIDHRRGYAGSISLFVGFENSSVVLKFYRRGEVLADGNIVCERDPNFLPRLIEVMHQGGTPIGWSRMFKDKVAGHYVIELGVTEDNQDAAWAYNYLKYFYTSESRKEFKEGTKFYLFYPDGSILDITDINDLTEG